jgi:hypothetical protein
MSTKSKNDRAWETLFQRHNILTEVNTNGVFEISAAEINEVREARLATKFDHWEQLPKIFQQNQLTIQPNTRGTYLIGRFESYQELPDEQIPIEGASFPPNIETINPAHLYSESAVLLCAYHTGIIGHLLGEDVSLTVIGRMSSGRFNYAIRNKQTGQMHDIKVENSQLEIDGGFEGENTFAIFEAKNQSVDDFLVRQLYYPYRLWAGKTSKRVVPVFLSYSNTSSVFSFYVFRFSEPTHYNSIKLVEQRKFQIVPSEIELRDIYEILGRVKVKPEPANIPFPQADNFGRIVDLLTQLYDAKGALSKDQITNNQAFNPRQTEYYTQAANYLGLVQKRRDKERERAIVYDLTQRGAKIIAQHPQLRNLALVECMFERRVFNEAFQLYLKQYEKPSKEQVVEIMEAARLGISGTTIPRRAQTVLHWIDWVLKLTR